MSNMARGSFGGGGKPGRFSSGPRQGFLPDSSRGGYGLEPGTDYNWQTDPSNNIPGPYDSMPAGYGRSGSVPSVPYVPARRFPPVPDAGFFQRFMFPQIEPLDPWGYQPQRPLNADYPYDFGSDWTELCRAPVPPNPAENFRKVGIVPGTPAISPTTCNNSAVSQANRAPGSDLPAGLTRVQLVQSGAAWPNVNGRPYDVWTHPASPAARPLQYMKGARVLPVSAPFGAVRQMQPEPAPSNKTVFMPRYFVPAKGIVVSNDGPPEKNPDDWHAQVPPAKGVKEDKPIDNTGRTLADWYGKLTEFKDMADCASGAITRKKRHSTKTYHPCHGMPLVQKLKCIADNAVRGDFDVPAFVECMAQNEVTDTLVGKISRATSRRLQHSAYSPRRHSPVGWGVGGFSTRMR